ncbi:MAG: hypothetical protein AAB870_01850, partial [Patescibacteria group bacterium]
MRTKQQATRYIIDALARKPALLQHAFLSALSPKDLDADTLMNITRSFNERYGKGENVMEKIDIATLCAIMFFPEQFTLNDMINAQGSRFRFTAWKAAELARALPKESLDLAHLIGCLEKGDCPEAELARTLALSIPGDMLDFKIFCYFDNSMYNDIHMFIHELALKIKPERISYDDLMLIPSETERQHRRPRELGFLMLVNKFPERLTLEDISQILQTTTDARITQSALELWKQKLSLDNDWRFTHTTTSITQKTLVQYIKTTSYTLDGLWKLANDSDTPEEKEFIHRMLLIKHKAELDIPRIEWIYGDSKSIDIQSLALRALEGLDKERLS